MHILNRLTPDMRESLLCETPKAIRLLRRSAAAVAELVIVMRYCHAEALALNVGALAKVRANVGDFWREKIESKYRRLAY